MDVEAVIFDMDGVIVNSEDYWVPEEKKILEETVEEDEVSVHDLTGMNEGDQYDYLAENYTVNISKEEHFQWYDNKAEEIYCEKVDLMDGFYGLLDMINAQKVQRAIVSSSFRDWIRMVVDRFDLAEKFDAIISAEDIDGRSKPAPDIYLYAAEQLDVSPEQCIVIEDSANGVEAAKNAGMYCIGYRSGEQDLSQADEVVEGPDALRTALERHL